MFYIWERNVLSYQHKLVRALTVFEDKFWDRDHNAFSVDTHEHSSLLTTSQLREGTQVQKQPLTVSGNAQQIELYKRKQK